MQHQVIQNLKCSWCSFEGGKYWVVSLAVRLCVHQEKSYSSHDSIDEISRLKRGRGAFIHTKSGIGKTRIQAILGSSQVTSDGLWRMIKSYIPILNMTSDF